MPVRFKSQAKLSPAGHIMAKRENKFAKTVRKEDVSNENFGLGRPFDFDDKFNRVAIMGALVATILLLIFRQVTGSGTGSVMLDGVSYAAGFFFAYLIGREVDPEPGREWGALLGAFITLGLETFMGVNINGVVGLLWMLFICRMFNRASGSRHRIGDNVIILGSAFWMGHIGYWLFPVVTGICYVLESQIKEGYFRSLYLAGIAFAMCVVTGRGTEVPVLSSTYLYMMGIAFILFLPQLTMRTVRPGMTAITSIWSGPVFSAPRPCSCWPQGCCSILAAIRPVLFSCPVSGRQSARAFSCCCTW